MAVLRASLPGTSETFETFFGRLKKALATNGGAQGRSSGDFGDFRAFFSELYTCLPKPTGTKDRMSMSDKGHSVVTDKLSVTFDYEDEWPLRVGEFIIDLSEWYVAHPSITQKSAVEIATFLNDALFDEGLIHRVSCIGVEPDVTDQTLHTVKSSIDFRKLCLALARMAFERYILPDMMRDHIAA